jgi:pyridoxal biosynthesis lyase PdxS
VTGIDVQGDAALFAQAPKDGLFLRGGLILSQGPDTPESVPANKIIR